MQRCSRRRLFRVLPDGIRTASAALAILLGLQCLGAGAALALEDIVDGILEAGTTGGTFGYRVRRVGGAVAANVNPGFVFYPASTIKVLQHLSMMRDVEDGVWDLAATDVQVCGGTTNCSDDPNVSVPACAAAPRSLSLTLSRMMVFSDNQDTNAIQELIGTVADPASPTPSLAGRADLLDFSTMVLGMSPSTVLHHKFACGNVDNTPSNTATLIDLELIYDAIARRPSVILPETRVLLKDRMKNEGSPDLAADLLALVDEEALATGKSDSADAFKSLVYMVYKAGDVSNSGIYRSNAGLIQLPTYDGNFKRLHSWASFIEDADTYVAPTLTNATLEMLRPAIRSALLTWDQLGFAVPMLAESEEIDRVLKLTTRPRVRRLLLAAKRGLDEAAGGASRGYLDREAQASYDASLRSLQSAEARAPRLGIERIVHRLSRFSETMAENALADASAASPNTEGLNARLVKWNRELARLKGHRKQQPVEGAKALGAFVQRAAEITGDRRQAEAMREDGFAPTKRTRPFIGATSLSR